MAAYDPKRPRPAHSSDEPAPVDALLEPAGAAEPAAATVPEESSSRNGSTRGRHGGSVQEVPVAPAPEVGTTNRAVLYASIGVAAVVAAVLVVLRIRSRRAPGASRAD